MTDALNKKSLINQVLIRDFRDWRKERDSLTSEKKPFIIGNLGVLGKHMW